MTGKYDDIIDMPHHVSGKHPQMSLYDRAAQFSPFAALTGHDAAVKETARLTDRRIELDDGEKAFLDEKLQQLLTVVEAAAERKFADGDADFPAVEITYFEPDIYKEGGVYLTGFFNVKRIDMHRHVLIMADLTEINIKDIIGIEIK